MVTEEECRFCNRLFIPVKFPGSLNPIFFWPARLIAADCAALPRVGVVQLRRVLTRRLWRGAWLRTWLPGFSPSLIMNEDLVLWALHISVARIDKLMSFT